MSGELILFIILALVAVVSACAMLFSRNAVYSALFLILNFSTIAVFYILLTAPFIAMAQITVYAGAIMVLFLFVIMLLGGQELHQATTVNWQRPVAILLGVVLLGEVGYLFLTRAGGFKNIVTSLTPLSGSPQDIGKLLFGQYVLPFEIVSILLLVAMVGVIVLTQTEKKG